MNEFLANFHFLRPLWLPALLLPLFFYWKYFRGLKSQSSWEKVCDKKLLDFLLIKGSSAQRRLVGFLGILGFSAGIIAAAGPSWKKTEVPSLNPENPVMILLNLSSDMQEKDLTPSRLDRAKYKIKDLLEGLQSPQAGLIVYTNEPFLISPITDDMEIIANLLRAVSYDIMPENGDRPDRAIELAVEKLKGAGYFSGNIVIFAPEAGTQLDKALIEARNAKDANYKVSAVGVRKTTDEKLKLITQYGGGIFEQLNGSDADIKKLDQFINDNVSELKLSDNMQSSWLDYGYYLCIVPLLCCLYFFRRGILAVALLLAVSGNAYAGMWLNNDQEALKAYKEGDYQQAADKFVTPAWKASAQYRLGNYGDALKNFASGTDETALYNQGNALAKGGKIEEAIKKYEEVLKIAPNHEDAKFNLEYLKQQQNQQQQNQNNRQNQQDNSDDNQEQQQSSGDNNDQNSNDRQDQNNDQNQEQQNSEQNKDQNSGQNQNDEQEQNAGQDQQQNDNPARDNPQNGQGQQESGAESKDEPQDAQETNAAQAQEDEDGEDYDEQKQARALRYRDIPEDPGGLLKAFIYKEYRLNRYGD